MFQFFLLTPLSSLILLSIFILAQLYKSLINYKNNIDDEKDLYDILNENNDNINDFILKK